jgi:hypothetical protein
MGLFTERDEETPNQIIIGKLNRIEAKLDAVIKAMHDYDGNDEYGESSFEAFMDTKDDIMSWKVDGAERTPPCVGHDAASWDDEEAANKRMDIIGQNGNEGLHYDKDEFDDYGKRVGKKDNPKQMNGVESNVPFVKTRNKRDKWVSPYPPNPKRKSAVVEHQKHPPHKH